MRRLSVEEVLVFHALIIDATGGSNGVRDPHLLMSLLEKPHAQFGGNDLYPTIWDKAAILFEAFVNYHVFVDGNKRTGVVVTARFLSLYGYVFVASNKDTENVAVSIATKETSIEELALWLEKNSDKMR